MSRSETGPISPFGRFTLVFEAVSGMPGIAGYHIVLLDGSTQVGTEDGVVMAVPVLGPRKMILDCSDEQLLENDELPAADARFVQSSRPQVEAWLQSLGWMVRAE